MFLATICLFTMYVCRVTLVTPDLQFMFAVPLTLGCLEKRRGYNGHGTRRWTTPGILVLRILPRMRAPPGRARWTRPRLPKLPRTQEVESWQENFRTIISSGVCAKLIYIFIFKWNMNITFSKIL